MAVTLAQLKAAVIVKLGETSDDGMLQDLTATINSGLQQMATEYDWPWLIVKDTFDTANGTADYTAPATCTRVRRLAIGTYLLQTRQDEEMLLLDEDTGQPYFYTVEGTTITLAPTPDAIYTVKRKYVKAEAVLSGDSDTCYVPAYYSDLAAIYGALEEARRRRDQALVNLLEQSRQQWIKRISDNIQRSKDMPAIRTRSDFD
jgi:hypothetical protein